jgi:hypothetical protein
VAALAAALAQAFIAPDPKAKVLVHPMRIGAGDWTALTGLPPDDSTMATIARWETVRIAAEYRFSPSV